MTELVKKVVNTCDNLIRGLGNSTANSGQTFADANLTILEYIDDTLNTIVLDILRSSGHRIDDGLADTDNSTLNIDLTGFDLLDLFPSAVTNTRPNILASGNDLPDNRNIFKCIPHILNDVNDVRQLLNKSIKKLSDLLRNVNPLSKCFKELANVRSDIENVWCSVSHIVEKFGKYLDNTTNHSGNIFCDAFTELHHTS